MNTKGSRYIVCLIVLLAILGGLAFVPGGRGIASDLTLEERFTRVWELLGGAQGRLGYAVGSAVEDFYAVEFFEHALMYWHGPTWAGTIYVIDFENGYRESGMGWGRFADTWREGMPEKSCYLGDPPPGLFQPVRGFGKLWCDRNDVRSSVGWATEKEWGQDGGYQMFEGGTMLWDPHNGSIWVLFNWGDWRRFPEEGQTTTGLVPTGRYRRVWDLLGGVEGRLGYALAEAVEGPYAVEFFEHALMYWHGPTWAGAIYVIQFENGYRESGMRWGRFADTWREGMPEKSCYLGDPPPGLFQPVRGFGKLWCDRDDVRSSVGWATEEEWGQDGGYQMFEGGTMLWDPHNGFVWVVFNLGDWQRFPEY